MLTIKVKDIDSREIITLRVDPSIPFYKLIYLIDEQRGQTKPAFAVYISPQGSYFTQSQIGLSLTQLKIKNQQTLLACTSPSEEKNCDLSPAVLKKALEEGVDTENPELQTDQEAKKRRAEWEGLSLECHYLVDTGPTEVKTKINPRNSFAEELKVLPIVLWELIMNYLDSWIEPVLFLEKYPDKFASYFKIQLLKNILDSEPIQSEKLLGVVKSMTWDSRLAILERLESVETSKLQEEWTLLNAKEPDIAKDPARFLEEALRYKQNLKLLLACHYFNRIPAGEVESVMKQVYPLSGHPGIGKMLFNLSQRADLTMLKLVCEAGHYQVIELLLQKNPRLMDSKTLPSLMTPSLMIKMCKAGNTEMVELMLEKKPALIKVKNGSNSLLSIACAAGHYQLSRLLLQKSPDLIHVENCHLEPPLITACSSRHFHLIPLLLNYNANVLYISSSRKTALSICIDKISYKDELQLQVEFCLAFRELLIHGADVELGSKTETRLARVWQYSFAKLQQLYKPQEMSQKFLFNEVVKILMELTTDLTSPWGAIAEQKHTGIDPKAQDIAQAGIFTQSTSSLTSTPAVSLKK